MKKVLTIVSLSIVGALLLATIILACIPVGSLPKFADPMGVVVYSSELGEVGKVDEDDKASNITSKMQSAVKQRCLSAIFNGTLKNMSIKTMESTIYVPRSNSETTKAKFEYKYAGKQTMAVNGVKFEYSSLLFEVNENDARDTMKIYVIKDDKTGDSVDYSHLISVDGNYSELFVYINELIEAHK